MSNDLETLRVEDLSSFREVVLQEGHYVEGVTMKFAGITIGEREDPDVTSRATGSQRFICVEKLSPELFEVARSHLLANPSLSNRQDLIKSSEWKTWPKKILKR